MKARKRFGQHFLESAWVRKLVDVVHPGSDDVVLEIGPGRGALTLPLASRVRRVIAVEIDRDLAAHLQGIAPPNVAVVVADFLRADLAAIVPPGERPVRVVGNLPYNISSPILFRLCGQADEGRFLSDATLMLQREVADRLVAQPNTGAYGVLGILIQRQADITRVLELPPGAFRPAPRVSSAVVQMAFRPPRPRVEDPRLFDAMVRTMFEQRRKTVANALRGFAGTRRVAAGEVLAKAGIDPRRRPETLELAELSRLADIFASAKATDVL
jgi:16S rRNA (adenine1518-N6/adenine1519-N6)-dimethyltransferase